MALAGGGGGGGAFGGACSTDSPQKALTGRLIGRVGERRPRLACQGGGGGKRCGWRGFFQRGSSAKAHCGPVPQATESSALWASKPRSHEALCPCPLVHQAQNAQNPPCLARLACFQLGHGEEAGVRRGEGAWCLERLFSAPFPPCHHPVALRRTDTHPLTGPPAPPPLPPRPPRLRALHLLLHTPPSLNIPSFSIPTWRVSLLWWPCHSRLVPPIAVPPHQQPKPCRTSHRV